MKIQKTNAKGVVQENAEVTTTAKEEATQTTEVAKVKVDHEEDTTDEANHTNKDGNLECSMCGSEDVGDYDGEVLCHKCAEENGLSAGEFPEETKTKEASVDETEEAKSADEEPIDEKKRKKKDESEPSAEPEETENPDEDEAEAEDDEDEFCEAISTLATSDPSMTEEFRRTAATIFEAAVTSKIRAHTVKLEEQYTSKLAEEVQRIENDLVEKVDSYLTYVAEEWMKANEVAVESGLRTEIAEDFMKSLKAVFTENYINVPESKKDLCNELVTRNDELKTELNNKNQKLNKLNESVEKLTRESILNEASRGLAMTQASKLKTLVEDVKFVDSETFTEKVNTIKESYFGSGVIKEEVKNQTQKKVKTVVETIVEDKKLPGAESSKMDKYTQALSRQMKTV